jgi:hypothetical protein
MTLGRGYDVVHDTYVPNRETAARATAAFDYYDCSYDQSYEQFPDKAQDTLYLFSGWYGKIASRGRMPEPPDGVSEAALAKSVFAAKVEGAPSIGRVWGNPHQSYWDKYRGVRTAVEDKSVDTFTNFTESIDAGHLTIGAFSAKSPLALSASKAHSWRGSVVAEQSLALEPNCLFRLIASGYETGLFMTMRERLLLAVTRLALADVGEWGGAEPGNLEHTKAAAQAFEEMSKTPASTLKRALGNWKLWVAPEVPFLPYLG